jgi:uncharacterized protein
MAISVIWRRLDTPGLDACRFQHDATGFRIDGTAVFKQAGAARLSYQLSGNTAWVTTHGRVQGFVGDQLVDVTIERAADGTWRMNQQIVPGLERCLHLDFGFTPATNFPQLRHAALRIGESAEVIAAWIEPPGRELVVLPQRYERRGERSYWYESPTANYAALLELTPDGIIRDYPDLWTLED